MSLSPQSVLITGACGDIGSALAKEFVNHGVRRLALRQTAAQLAPRSALCAGKSQTQQDKRKPSRDSRNSQRRLLIANALR